MLYDQKYKFDKNKIELCAKQICDCFIKLHEQKKARKIHKQKTKDYKNIPQSEWKKAGRKKNVKTLKTKEKKNVNK